MSARGRRPPVVRHATLPALALALSACSSQKVFGERTESMAVAVHLPGGQALPTADKPLPLPSGPVELDADIRALKADGTVATHFSGFVRITVEPGSVISVQGPGAEGRNALVKNGVATGVHVFVQSARGPTRLWVEDIGYVPADPFKPPECADGIDNDGDGKIDYPEDPGCAFANDDTETPGTFAAGVSQPVYFQKPRLADIQGLSASTPYSEQAVDALTDPPAQVIVTRVAADGFYATDITEKRGYGHIYAYTFSTPGGLAVCDQLTQLSGTASEFFGFTELGFPSYSVHEWHFPDKYGTHDGPCLVPEPWVIDKTNLGDPAQMESHESGLVRLQNVQIASEFGPKTAPDGQFSADQSNCDLDGNGTIDFSTPGSKEAACADACAQDPQCSEWSEYVSRGNYRVNLIGGGGSIQINTGTITGFDPTALRGKVLDAVTGTLRNFSGGSLNWTVETRCRDDLVCTESNPFCSKGPQKPVSSSTACVSPRTTYDPNEATN